MDISEVGVVTKEVEVLAEKEEEIEAHLLKLEVVVVEVDEAQEVVEEAMVEGEAR